MAEDPRALCQAPTLEATERALEAFEDPWDERALIISRTWRTTWPSFTPLFDFTPELRRVMYLTDAVQARHPVALVLPGGVASRSLRRHTQESRQARWATAPAAYRGHVGAVSGHNGHR